MNLSDYFDVDDLIMSSTAYYLGRRTISVEDFCNRLVHSWPFLANGVQQYIKRIVEAAFQQYESITGSMYNHKPLGDACDVESWCKVRACWAADSEPRKPVVRD